MKHTRVVVTVAANALALAMGLACATSVRAQSKDIGNERRITLFPYHKINDQLTGFGYLGYVNNPEKEYKTAYLGYGGNYSINKSVQVWAGLISTYTNNQLSADKLELRPFVGSKFFLPNNWKWNIYSFTRYEYRYVEDRDTQDWKGTHRARTRFGVESPLTSREKAWQPKTFYGIADVEAFYRFDKGWVDPFRIRGGIAYVVNDRVRAEFIYHAQYTHSTSSGSLEYTDNIYRLNIKIGLNKGLLRRVSGGGDMDD